MHRLKQNRNKIHNNPYAKQPQRKYIQYSHTRFTFIKLMSAYESEKICKAPKPPTYFSAVLIRLRLCWCLCSHFRWYCLLPPAAVPALPSIAPPVSRRECIVPRPRVFFLRSAYRISSRRQRLSADWGSDLCYGSLNGFGICHRQGAGSYVFIRCKIIFFHWNILFYHQSGCFFAFLNYPLTSLYKFTSSPLISTPLASNSSLTVAN